MDRRHSLDNERAQSIIGEVVAAVGPVGRSEDWVRVIELADRIDHLDHALNDGRVIGGKTILGGTEIQDECAALRELARSAPGGRSCEVTDEKDETIKALRREVATQARLVAKAAHDGYERGWAERAALGATADKEKDEG
jgi:hypothetical protein